MSILYKQTIRSIGNNKAGRDANSIKNRLLSDFYHHGDVTLEHHPYYDEPTYLSFRISFTFDNPSLNDSLNDMPMPLLYSTKNYSNKYSTINYLIDQKEQIRADYLSVFINKLKDIEYNYPFYFKSIEGIGNLLKVNTSSGRRLKEGENILTIKCLEGLDLKIIELLNLYKKIAWDDVYQRWVLPDMMRYFQMKIYISEIRNFHDLVGSNGKSGNSNLLESSLGKYGRSNTWGNQLLNSLENTAIVNKAVGMWNKVKSAIDSFKISGNDGWELFTDKINNYMPTLCLTCNLCEFIIDDMFSNFTTFASNNKTALDDLIIKIKVGNLMESQFYPLDNNEYEDLAKHTALLDEELYRPRDYKWNSKDTELGYLYGNDNKRNYFKADGANLDIVDRYTVYDNTKKTGILNNLLNSVVGEVVNNAIDSAIGHIDQMAMELANRGLNAKLGNTDLTVQGMLNALSSKNIFSMIGYVRDSINKEVNSSEQILINDIYSVRSAALSDISALSNSSATRYDVIKDASGNEQENDLRNNILNPYKDIQTTNKKLPNSEATKNAIDYLSDSSRVSLNNEYNNLQDNASSKSDSFATYISNDQSLIKHSIKGDQVFKDFMKEIGNLPLSEATAEQKLVIEIAKEIGESDMNTKELDQLFYELKQISNEELKKSIQDPKDKMINGNKELNINFKPELTETELIQVSSLINSEYADLIKNLRKLSLSTATDRETKEYSLNLYNILKNYIDSNDESSTVKRKIEDILNKEDLSDDDKKHLMQFYELSITEKDLSALIESMKDIKSSVSSNKISSEMDYHQDEKSLLENLPDSEAIKNTYIYTEVFNVEKPNTDKPSLNTQDFEDIKKDYKNLPDSEAIENLTYTNEVIKVVEPENDSDKPNYIKGFEDIKNYEYEKSDSIEGFKDIKSDYKNLPDSEAIENLTYTNEIFKVNDVNDIDKSDSIKGFEDIKNYEYEKSDSIKGFEDIKKIEDIKNNKGELSKVEYNLPDSEATENWYDEMNADKRKNLESEFTNLKNE